LAVMRNDKGWTKQFISKNHFKIFALVLY
jgi:hypothetical protein